MALQFTKATKEQARARIALFGPSGSGKTYTSLRIAGAMGEKVAVIDTEYGSASLYADQFNFDALNLDTFSPATYIQAIKVAEAAGYDVLIIDSLSHAWMGKDGALELVERAKGKYGGNQWSAWADVTPLHRDLIETIIGSKLHIIATMRSKTEWEVQKDDKGKVKPVKIGTAPIQRDGMEYEFTVTALLDTDHTMHIDKTRCPALDGKSFSEAGEDVAQILMAWLSDGTPTQNKSTTATQSNGAGKSPVPVDTTQNGDKKPASADDAGKSEHWIADNAVRARFWVYTKEEIGLSRNQVHEALGVESVYDFDGTKTEAVNRLREYVDELNEQTELKLGLEEQAAEARFDAYREEGA